MCECMYCICEYMSASVYMFEISTSTAACVFYNGALSSPVLPSRPHVGLQRTITLAAVILYGCDPPLAPPPPLVPPPH